MGWAAGRAIMRGMLDRICKGQAEKKQNRWESRSVLLYSPPLYGYTADRRFVAEPFWAVRR
jgi:hypothetical protein